MKPLQKGAEAPSVPGLPSEGPAAVMFYKVTCPTCQTAAPAMERLAAGAPGRVAAVVQDPPERAEEFSREYGTTFVPVSDEPPYGISSAYGIRIVPAVVVIEDGKVSDTVESWDREGWNRAAEALGLGPVSEEGDGLPQFRPG